MLKKVIGPPLSLAPGPCKFTVPELVQGLEPPLLEVSESVLVGPTLIIAPALFVVKLVIASVPLGVVELITPPALLESVIPPFPFEMVPTPCKMPSCVKVKELVNVNAPSTVRVPWFISWPLKLPWPVMLPEAEFVNVLTEIVPPFRANDPELVTVPPGMLPPALTTKLPEFVIVVVLKLAKPPAANVAVPVLVKAIVESVPPLTVKLPEFVMPVLLVVVSSWPLDTVNEDSF